MIRFRLGLFPVVCLAMMRSFVCLASPCLSFPDGGILFGDIQIGTNAIGYLELRNTGSVPVSVSMVRACCGAVADLNQTKIAPDGTATLSVSFTPKSSGPFSKTIQIACNDPKRPLFTIPISGVAVASHAKGAVEGKSCEMVAMFLLLACLSSGLLFYFFRWRSSGAMRDFKTAARNLFSLSCRMMVGGAFVYAGAAKMCDVKSFAGLMFRYDILPDTIVPLFAVCIPAAEFVFGGLLVFGRFLRLSSIAVSIMLVMFIVALSQAAIRGLDVSCGCFGGIPASGLGSIWLAIIRDVLMLVCISPNFCGQMSRQECFCGGEIAR